MILKYLKEKIMAKKEPKKVAWEVPVPTEESVPTTPVPEVNDEGFNV